jgi:nucleoside-diphosphate-sugar epimerase
MESSGYENTPKYTEADWNTRSAPNCDALGKEAHPADKYFASKVLAERAAWEFAKTHEKEIKFDFVAINPDFVHGPFLHDVPSPDKLNTSLSSLFNAVIKRSVPKEQLGQPAYVLQDL